ncbi:DMP19 family protein [Caulobacter vibrioides]|uniref:DMP19 family protein n=1 Tax=Caulobacter vibrioides TaxID=155892 RepID=UPI0013DE33FE
MFLAGFSAVPTPSKHLLATHWLQSEVHNGGFSQFFSNSTGVLAPEAVAGSSGPSECRAQRIWWKNA